MLENYTRGLNIKDIITLFTIQLDSFSKSIAKYPRHIFRLWPLFIFFIVARLSWIIYSVNYRCSLE